ncbi:MAG: hypothetical protein H7067_15740 [Burkholderiales bacterium]|nr:hypothetical protein [Opitutaceae bacterium]
MPFLAPPSRPAAFRSVTFTLTLLALAGSAPAQTAYLPAVGEVVARPLYSYQRATDFYALGDTEFTLPDPLEQHTARVDLDYGLAPGWALDASFGWSTVIYDETQPPFLGISLLEDGETRQSGLIDTRLGVRRVVLDEFASMNEYAPTVALRAGAIIQGTYDTGFINAVGDGASGVEFGVLAAKSLVATGTTFFGDLVWRGYTEDVPDAVEASLGVSQQVQAASLTLGIRHLHSLNGPDILGPGFTSLESFSDVKEVNTSLELGLSIPVGPVTAGLGYAWTIDGANTPKKHVVALSATTGF